ncbi:DUF503 domain-containing protein [Fusibacter sp. JL216-2]|uniref:DUF503 domain-containing protein n=1 Tax=Fusibacter sp. JL216-2 TaxID=3071453 RepID=UPI003D358A16
MFVGIGYVKIRIYEAYSLKDRRQVVRSVTQKIEKKHNLSVATIDDGSLWNLVEIGFAGVSSNKAILESMYKQVGHILDEDYRFEVVDFIVDIQKEILR